ncbi:MAG: DNA/RNA non-specific endonuclease, partial [Armatimonadetes bacterium]|nr:DNA/RNA non-specific endonuclease [Armatimonadota bacterium]
MPRRSPFRSLSWPTVLLFVAIIGCRQWQKQAETPTSPPTQTDSRPPSRVERNQPVSPPTTGSSNEGNLLLGNPSNANRNEANFLLERPQYSLSYNRAKGGPNWVAWHTDASNLGDLERGKFAPDPDLPPSWRIRPTDYKGSGYDRGHVLPSGDRTASREDNSATFYMSNMLPQTGALNRHVWADLENYVREQIREGNEAYQLAGGAGSAGTIAGGKVTIPQICWKVVVILPLGTGDLGRINARTRVIAVGMPNVEDKRLETGDWR